MGFLDFMADPVGVYDIIKPSGQGSASAPDRGNYAKDHQAIWAQERGAQNAAGAASSAGSSATAQHWYASGADWNPGMPVPIDKNTKAYQQYAKYTQSQGGAAGAASAAGTYATQQHYKNESDQRQKQATADQQERDKSGLDMMKPGAGEQFYADNQQKLMSPGSYQDWWKTNGAQMQNPGAAENYASQVLSKYSGGSQLPPADYGAYYDRAAQKATQGLNDQLASRGQYGSSVGLGMIGTQLADLAAQRAKDEATYGLARSADERNWMTSLGGVASDAEKLGMERWSQGGQGAALNDTLGLSRWKTGEQAAMDAQNAQRQRGQDLFNNERGIGGDLANIAGSAYGANNATDSALLDAILAMSTGQASEGVAAAQSSANKDAANQQQLMALLQAYATASQSGGKK